MTAQDDMLDPLSPAERERFESLAPYAGTATLTTSDSAWLSGCLARHPALAPQLAQHQALRAALHERFAAVPDDIGLARVQMQIAALKNGSRAERPHASAAAPGWGQRLRDWLQAGPAWALACAVLLLPLGFLVGRETAPTPYAEMRGSPAPGLLDGPLLRVNFEPQTSEQQMRELLLAQGAVVVGPTRLGDWFLKVAPARIDAVRGALAQQKAVASAEVVRSLPSELLETP